MEASPPCAECVFHRYPAQYPEARRAAALPVTVISTALLLVGLALFFMRWRAHLIAKRNRWLIVGVSLNTLLCLYVPYREYYGEGAMPCVLLLLLPNILFALVPAGLIVRFFGLYTQHVRQRMAVDATGTVETDGSGGTGGAGIGSSLRELPPHVEEGGDGRQSRAHSHPVDTVLYDGALGGAAWI